jgi:hypothetical protein
LAPARGLLCTTGSGALFAPVEKGYVMKLFRVVLVSAAMFLGAPALAEGQQAQATAPELPEQASDSARDALANKAFGAQAEAARAAAAQKASQHAQQARGAEAAQSGKGPAAGEAGRQRGEAAAHKARTRAPQDMPAPGPRR